MRRREIRRPAYGNAQRQNHAAATMTRYSAALQGFAADERCGARLADPHALRKCRRISWHCREKTRGGGKSGAARFLSAVLLTLRRIAFSFRQLSKALYPPFLHWNQPLERRSWNGFWICRGFSAHSDAARKSGASCPRSAMKKTAKRSPSFATRSTTRRKIPALRLFSLWRGAGTVRG